MSGESGAYRVIADAEHFGYPDRRHAEDGAGEHRPNVGRDRGTLRESAREQQGAHEGGGNECAGNADQGEGGELGRLGDAHGVDLEQGRALETRVRDHVAHGGRYRDGREGA